MDNKTVELIIVRGLPGSGKSTIAKGIAEKTGAIHVEADDFFVKGGVYRFEPDSLPDAHAYCLSRCESLVSNGHSVVVANTFTQRWEMQPYLELASHYGARVRIIIATGKFQNIHGVPAETIEKMRIRWED